MNRFIHHSIVCIVTLGGICAIPSISNGQMCPPPVIVDESGNRQVLVQSDAVELSPIQGEEIIPLFPDWSLYCDQCLGPQTIEQKDSSSLHEETIDSEIAFVEDLTIEAGINRSPLTEVRIDESVVWEEETTISVEPIADTTAISNELNLAELGRYPICWCWIPNPAETLPIAPQETIVELISDTPSIVIAPEAIPEAQLIEENVVQGMEEMEATKSTSVIEAGIR